MPRHPNGVWSIPPGPAPPTELLELTENDSKVWWILRGPFQGPVRSNSGGPTLPRDLQCGGRRNPPALDLRGGSNGWDRGASHRGVWTGHPTDGGIFLF